jgi:phage terminase large subunit-like protein
MSKAKLEEFAAFCGTLTLSNGEAMKLEAFQRKMLRDYFAGVLELVIVIPKKNGKTTLLAALALHHLLTTDDADCVIVANSSLQAMKLFDEAKGFVQRNDDLREQLRVLRGYKEIRRKNPDQPDNPKEFIGTIKVLAADADTADGWGGTLALFDELHRAKDGELYGVLFDGLGPRSGQLITISTAGETEDSPLGTIRKKAYDLDVQRQGAYRYATTGAFSMHEWALEPTEDRDDLKLVKTANPASWQTLDQLQKRHSSLGMTPHRWARFACGVWGLGGEAAFDPDTWDSLAAGGQPEPGRPITLGFDGARRRDDTGLVGCDLDTGHLFVLGHWHKPADADDSWAVPEGEVNEVVEHAFETWQVLRFYCDPPYWESAVDRWEGSYGGEKVVPWWTNRIKQTAMALRTFSNDMHSGELSHDGDPKLTEHVHNAVRQETRMIEDDEPLWVIRKDSKDSPRKIDLAMAALLAWEARGDAISEGAADANNSVYFL